MTTTYKPNLSKVRVRVYPQNLDCDLTTLVVTLPHFRVPTPGGWGALSIVALWDA